MDNDWHSLGRQVSQSSPIGAVARFGLCAAIRTGVGRRLSTVTIQACSPRSTLRTFKPPAGDHAIDVFIAPCCRIPSLGASQPAHHREHRKPRRLHQESIRPSNQESDAGIRKHLHMSHRCRLRASPQHRLARPALRQDDRETDHEAEDQADWSAIDCAAFHKADRILGVSF
jgi:hypothetical protein